MPHYYLRNRTTPFHITMGSTNTKPIRHERRTQIRPRQVVHNSRQDNTCYICDSPRSSRLFRLGPDQFICSGTRCGRIKYALEQSLNCQPVILVNCHKDDDSYRGQSNRTPRSTTSARGVNAGRRISWRPTLNIINPRPPQNHMQPSRVIGRSELMGDSRQRRSAIQPH